MAVLVKDLYNRLAVATGFPLYTNETDTPDINRFLLEQLSEALLSVIDDCYICNNVLERTDTITTSKFKDEYGIDGIIKNVQLIQPNSNKTLEYNQLLNTYDEIEHEVLEKDEETGEPIKMSNTGIPSEYVIRKGYLKLLPMPDQEYTIKLTLSTTDLVSTDNDEYRDRIESVDDSILANNRFCDLVLLKACVLVFTRLQNANAGYYSQLLDARMKTFLEHDIGSTELMRGYNRQAGHYNYRGGLLD